ncbi:glycosyltransferase [Cellulosimicrobium funkei]|nr:glycosyltransferase [Cellulosimicrobium funkei]
MASSSDTPNYLFLSFAVSEQQLERITHEDSNPPIQTHLFTWNLIRSLIASNQLDLTLVSAAPTSAYPANHNRKIRGSLYSVPLLNRHLLVREISYDNRPGFRLVSRMVSAILVGHAQYAKVTHKAGIIVYSNHIPFMIAGHVLAWVYQLPFIAIWTDPPAVPRAQSGSLHRALRSIEFRLARILMKRSDSVIALTEALAKDFAPDSDSIVVEGIIDPSDYAPLPEDTRHPVVEKPFRIAYTGAISSRYGVLAIIDGFCEAALDHAELHFYGTGPSSDEIERRCSLLSNVYWHGWTPRSEILHVQSSADLLINARSPIEDFVKYSFPSKTLEYMMSGTTVATTMLPGIPEEYRNFIIPIADSTSSQIGAAIQTAFDMGVEGRNALAREAYQFASSKDYQNQGRRIWQLLDRVKS